MPKLNYLIICDRAFDEAGSNKLNIIGIFDTINSKKFPIAHSQFTVVSDITFDDELEHKMKLMIKKENDTLSLTETNIGGKKRQRWRNDFINIIFPEQGDYFIELWIDDKLLGTETLHLKLSK